MALDIKVEIEKLQQMYKDDPRQQRFCCLATGEMGTGKTSILGTAPMPMHIDSFDPGGTKPLRNLINQGKIIADTTYENEDPTNPSMFAKWKENLRYRRDNGYFDMFASYALDSSTLWMEAAMNLQLKSEGISGKAPRFTKDYNPVKYEIRNWFRQLMKLPCNIFVTGHLEAEKDGAEGQIVYRYMTIGKGQVNLPILFDEVYVMVTRPGESGLAYQILTKSTGKYLARSRLGKEGTLNTYEPADMRKLLKKAGYPANDKPELKEALKKIEEEKEANTI